RSETPTRPAVSLPAGYNTDTVPVARTASAGLGGQRGYEPLPRTRRQVLFAPRQESVPVPIEEIRAYLSALVEEHSDHAAQNSNQGALPYARVVADDED